MRFAQRAVFRLLTWGLLCLYTTTHAQTTPPAEIRVGGMLWWSEDDGKFWSGRHSEDRTAYHLALDAINDDPSVLPNTRLVSEFELVSTRDEALTASVNLGRGVNCGSDGRSIAKVAGSVGPATSSQSTVAAVAAAVYQYPIISMTATSTALSDKAIYPYFGRTVPTDDAQGRALASLVKSLGWTSVCYMSSGDTYGQRGIAEFSAAAKSLDIAVAFGIVVSETATSVEDLLPQMTRLKDNNCHIIQLFGLFKTKLAMEGAARLGMVGSDYAWLAAEGNLNGQVGPSDDPADAVYQRAAQGIIGTLPSSGDGLAADQKFRKLFTDKTSPNDSPLNDYYDWKGDGVPNGYGVPYTYDAVWMLAHAWHNMIGEGLDVENGALVLQALKNVSFAGVTGQVGWDMHNNRKYAKFDVIQVYGDENGRLQSKIIGNVDPSASEDKFLSLTQRPTFWDGTTTVPADGAVHGANNNMRTLIVVVSVSLLVVILALVIVTYLLYMKKEAHPWRIKEGEVQLQDLIGAGSFGEVYAAQWRGSKVAAKRLTSEKMDKTHLAEFKQEVAVMVNLRHPNVTLFMGAVISKNDLMIISEFMEGGSLYDILHSPKSRQNNNMQSIYSTMTHIARGMNYLHSAEPPIVHNDLKSCNILVDDNQVAKVADFGLTKFTGSTIFGRLDALMPSDKENPPIGSLLWAPPEVLIGHEGTPASDVYAFGVIFWEMLTHSNPWPGMLAYAAAFRVMEGQRLEIPRNTPERVAKLLRGCWAQHPGDRPSMAECLKQLSAWSKDGQDRQRIYYHERVDMARIEAPAPTGDVTLVFTDVEDSTTLWALAPLKMREALDIHNEIFRDFIHEFGGYEVKTEGDSFMIAFPDAWKAVCFCCEVQEALVDAEWPVIFSHGGNPGCRDADERVVWNGLRVRMGMHTGQPTAKIDVTSERMDYFGPQVNKAARVGGLPRGGQIFISSATAEIIAPHVAAQSNIVVSIAGLFPLKGIEESEQCSQVNTVRLQGRIFRPKGASPIPPISAQASSQASTEVVSSSSLLPPPSTSTLAQSMPASPVGKVTIARIRAGSASVATGSTGPPPLVTAQRTASGTVLSSGMTSSNVPPTINMNELVTARASRKVSDPKTTPGLPRLIRNDTALALAKRQLEGKDIISIFDIEWGQQRLGTGTYGDVYLGKYKGRSVAVKRMHVSHVTHSVMMSFVKEAKLMKGFHHPFILGFIGVVVEETDLCIIMEIAEGGTLMDRLRNMSHPDWSWGLNVLAQVASGVAFLHGLDPPIIHRDLKSANILFDTMGGVKLADFGMAKVKMAQQAFTVAGTPAYSAPELLRGDPYSESVDVFSFGIIMWEMWTRKDPFGSLPAVKVMFKITNGDRPPLPAQSMGRRMSVTLKKLSRNSNEKNHSPTLGRHAGSQPPSDYIDLMQDCWQADPKRRPTMAQVLNRLMAMGANLDTTMESAMSAMDAMADASIAEVDTDEELDDDVDIGA